LPFINDSAFVACVFAELAEVRPDTRRFLLWAGPAEASTGERDRVRARFSREESELEPEPSFSSDIGSGDLWCCCFAADLVIGAK
jgi:uncharacterized membrane-anchored protein